MQRTIFHAWMHFLPAKAQNLFMRKFSGIVMISVDRLAIQNGTPTPTSHTLAAGARIRPVSA